MMNQATKNQLDVQDLKGKYSNRAGGGWGGGEWTKTIIKKPPQRDLERCF